MTSINAEAAELAEIIPLGNADLTVVRENAIRFSLPAAASSVQKLAMTYVRRSGINE